MEILEADREDIPGIQRVARDTWRRAYVDILGADTVEDIVEDDSFYEPTDIESMILSPDAELFVAREDRSVYGFIGLSWTEDLRENSPHLHESAAEITVMYVHPSKWGLGIGTDLYETAIMSIPDDIAELYVRFLVDNEAGRGFYESLGFETVDTHQDTVSGHEHDIRLATKEV